MTEFLTYKKFQNQEQARELLDILEDNDIPFEILDNSRPIADSFFGQDMQSKIIIKIPAVEFEKVNQLYGDYAKLQINDFDEDYYLFKFDNDELLEIIAEPDQWSEQDKQLAIKILGERGIPVNNELAKTLYNTRIKQLSTEEDASSTLIFFGYFFAVLGGFLGFAIGLNLWTHRKTLPNGTRVYAYREKDRRHGQFITIMGLILFLGGIFLQARYKYFH